MSEFMSSHSNTILNDCRMHQHKSESDKWLQYQNRRGQRAKDTVNEFDKFLIGLRYLNATARTPNELLIRKFSDEAIVFLT